jgi:hypothetical protein
MSNLWAQTLIFALSCVGAEAWIPQASGGDAGKAPARPRIASTAWCKPPTNAKEFRKFIYKCSKEGFEYRLSLKRLAREMESIQRDKQVYHEGHGILEMVEAYDRPALKLSGQQVVGFEDPHFCYGFNVFFGFVVTSRDDGGDVILLGMHDSTRSPMDADHVATAVRVTSRPGLEPACSLDPIKNNPGFQKSVVLGVPWESRWAECMLAADYRMKALAMGLTLDRRVLPYAHRRALTVQRNPGQSEGNGETNRFWFTRAASDTRPRSLILAQGPGRRSADALLMTRNEVVLLTEKEMSGQFGTGQKSDDAVSFAADFTADLERIGVRYPSIGDLLSIFGLLDLLVHVRLVGRADIPGEDFWTERYRTCSTGPPKRYRTLDREVVFGTRRRAYSFGVTGGVQMPLNPGPNPDDKEPAQDVLRLVLADWPASR